VADQIDMGLWNWGREEPMPKGTLTADERIALDRLEATVDAGVQATLTVLEAGKALAEIRDRQLYRDTAPAWETYVSQRFKITKRRADQMVAFAGVKAVLEEMGTGVPILCGERTLRPLVGLEPGDMAEAITEAAESPEGVTAASVRKAAAKRKKGRKAVPKARRFKVPGAIVTVTFNKKSNGLAVEALEAAWRQASEDQATEAA
jgi:hypothetical protein